MRTRAIGGAGSGGGSGSGGIQASVIAMGTWAIGGWMWGGADEDEAVRAIHAALDRGINLFDTAPIYGFGHSEIVVGRALKGRRDKAVIATKCGMVCNTRAGELKMRSTASGPSEHGHIEVYIYNNPESIRREVEDSLKRLQTDRIDLYQTHWQEGVTPLEETMGALVRLREEGKIRAIGVCNATVAQMERYRSVGRLDSDQEKYSMLDRKMDAEQLPWCERNGVAVLAYSPLVLGLLTGTAGPERVYAEGDMRRTHKRFTVENRTRVRDLLKKFEPIATRHGCTMGQLVIAWTLAQRGVTHALVGARNVQQVEENAKAGEIELSAAEVAEMNAALKGFELV